MNILVKTRKIFWTKSDVLADVSRHLTQVRMNLPATDFANTEDLIMKPRKYVTYARLLRQARRFGIVGATFLLMAMPTSSPATPLDLSSAPLFLTGSVQPNILFVVDDSGSMDWNMMTSETDGVMYLTAGGATTLYTYVFPQVDNNYGSTSFYGRILPSEAAVAAAAGMPADRHGVWRGRFSGYNTMYYNPNVTYTPWQGVDAAGVAFANATPTSARLNPYVTTGGTNVVNLTANMLWSADRVPRTNTALPRAGPG